MNVLDNDEVKYSWITGEVLIDKESIINTIIQNSPDKVDFHYTIYRDEDKYYFENEDIFHLEIYSSIYYKNNMYVTLHFFPTVNSTNFILGTNSFESSLCSNYDDFEEDIFQLNNIVKEKLFNYIPFFDITTTIKQDIKDRKNIVNDIE